MIQKYAPRAIAIVAFFAVMYFMFENYSNFHFGNVLASQEVTSGVSLQSFRSWMSFHESRIGPFIESCASAGVEDRKTPADGAWNYVTTLEKDRRYEFRGVDKCLGEMWISKLQELGYFKEPQKRPDPLRLTEFIIREPTGRTWVSSESASGAKAKQLYTLIVMMGVSNDDWDVRPCMRMKRGTFPYAVAFSGIVKKLNEQQKLEISCSENAEARIMAAEMLAATIPLTAGKATSSAFDVAAYESMLVELAKPTSVADKRRVFEALVNQANSRVGGDRQADTAESPARPTGPEAAKDGREQVTREAPSPGVDVPHGTATAMAEAAGGGVSGEPARFRGFVKYAPSYAMCSLLVGIGLLSVCFPSVKIVAQLVATKDLRQGRL